MKKNDMISIVVPCFNVENYLERCVKSLLGQSYENIEIILVDDGSTDNTSYLVNKYSKLDSRIVAVRQKNGGLSAARNAGLRMARGGYICFVDSDDFVDPDYIRKMYESMKRTGSDICACNFDYVYENGGTKKHPASIHKTYTSWEGLVDLFSGKQVTSIMTWNKLYKIDLFVKNNIIFPVGKINEDNFTTYKLYYYAKRISYIPDVLYFYLQRNDSIMGKTFNYSRMHILEAYDETVEFFRTHGINADIDEYLLCYKAFIYVNLLNKIIRSGYYGRERQIIRDEIIVDKKKYYTNKVLCFKIKCMILMIDKAPFIYEAIVAKKKGV